MKNTMRLRLQNQKAGIFSSRHLQSIAAVFRAVEIILFIAVISRCSLMVPTALQMSGSYFHDVAVTVVSPKFVFVVGNAIVIVLFVKSGGRLPRSGNSTPEIDATTYIVSVHDAGKSVPAAEVRVKCYRRSKSERVCVKRRCTEGAAAVLRRTKTEKRVRSERIPEDKMSSEEFRRTIEDFIDRQQRFLREEEEDESGALAVTG